MNLREQLRKEYEDEYGPIDPNYVENHNWEEYAEWLESKVEALESERELLSMAVCYYKSELASKGFEYIDRPPLPKSKVEIERDALQERIDAIRKSIMESPIGKAYSAEGEDEAWAHLVELTEADDE